MKVAIIIESRRVDGPTRNLFYALDLLRNRIAFTLVTFVRGAEEETEFTREVRARGYALRLVREGFRYDPRAILALGRLLRQLEPDVCRWRMLSHAFLSSFSSGLARRVLERTLFFFHGETWTDAKQRVYNRLDRFLLRQAHRVAVVSPFQRDLLAGWGIDASRILVIPNAIPEVEANPRQPVDIPLLVTAGRLSREKGHGILIRAAARLCRTRPNGFRLRIYGEGPEQRALSVLVEEHGLAGIVSLAAIPRTWRQSTSRPTCLYCRL